MVTKRKRVIGRVAGDEGSLKAIVKPHPLQFRGAIATSGNSLAIRMEMALTRADTAFGMKGRAVRFDIIGPGKALVTVEGSDAETEEDPMIDAWLGFLTRDSIEHPEHVHLVGEDEVLRLQQLVQGVVVTDDEEIPADVTF